MALLSRREAGASDSHPEARQVLHAFLPGHMNTLHGIIRTYVHRFGLATGEQIQSTAVDVLQETIKEALEHADRFVASGESIAWLLGVALNIVRRKKAERARRGQRELQLSSLAQNQSEFVSEADVFDQISPHAVPGPEQAVEDDEQAHALLALVSSEDQQVLRLALLEDFDRQQLAERLGTTPGTARMRLHRALRRLREAWHGQQDHL